MSIVLSLHPLVLVGYFGCWSKHEIGSLYSTLHPASQNSLKDMNDELARSGTIWAICAGKLGKVYEASVCWLNHETVKNDYAKRICCSIFIHWCIWKELCPVFSKSKIPWSIGVRLSMFIILLQTSLYIRVHHCFFIIININNICNTKFVELGTVTYGVGIGWLIHIILRVYMFVMCCPKDLSVLNRMSRLTKQDRLMHAQWRLAPRKSCSGCWRSMIRSAHIPYGQLFSS